MRGLDLDTARVVRFPFVQQPRQHNEPIKWQTVVKLEQGDTQSVIADLETKEEAAYIADKLAATLAKIRAG
jgi:hypothetical protein